MHFLRLMEKCDLSYRTLEDKDISLVVERLTLDPPDYENLWNRDTANENVAEIAMTMELNTIPAGIPTWFIARSHRFTTYTHWRFGALLADRQNTHLALIRANHQDNRVSLAVRGPYPNDFFALLKDGFELTLRRFGGLRVRRTMPCPGHDSNRCPHYFDYEHLLAATKMQPPVLESQCPVSFQDVPIPGLLFGIHYSTNGSVISKIELEAMMEDQLLDLKLRWTQSFVQESGLVKL